MSAPDPPHWTVTTCFGVFHSVWVHLGLFRNCMKLGAKWDEHSCHEVTSGFFAINAPNILRLTLNSYFGASHSIWVHLGLFRNRMKLDAKQGELVQLMRKLVPRSHAGIFLNERT